MHNPATRVARENARAAALAVGITRAAYLPNLSASVVGAYQTNSRAVTALGTRIDDDS
jgi:outer membrane protein TolC